VGSVPGKHALLVEVTSRIQPRCAELVLWCEAGREEPVSFNKWRNSHIIGDTSDLIPKLSCT